ncbi:tetracycline resistance MFS efflux pump [Bacillaceae bacterium]
MKRKLAVISGILTTIFIGFGIIIPVIPEVVDDLGAQPLHLGLMLAIYSAMSFFFSPLWGAFSDRVGRRPVIMTGLLGFSVSFFIFAIGTIYEHLPLMYVSRIFGGLFSGAATSCAIAYIADITSEEERTRGMALAGMSIGLGFIIGPAVGGLLSVYGLAVPFFTSAVLALLALLFAWRFLEESLPERPGNERKNQRVSRRAAFSGPVKYLYLLSFFVSFTLAFLESTLQFFEKVKIDATPAEIGLMFAINGIVGTAIQGGFVRRKVKHGQEARTILVGLVLSAAGFFLILFSSNFWNATLFISVFAAGNALIRPCVTSLVTQKTTVGQGVASGLISSMDSLGRITGPVAGTLLYQVNIHFPYLFATLISIASLLLLYGFLAADKKMNVAKTS